MSLYKQHPEGPWWVNITHDSERIRRSTGEYDRKAAQRVHDEIKASLWSVTPKLKGRTWGTAVLRWCEKETRSESELLSLTKFGRHYPDRVLTAVDAESVHKALSFCKTAGTYTRYRTMIAAILNEAKSAGWIREVPKLMTRTDKKTKPREWITHEQWEKLYAELPAHQKPMAAFAVATGLRQANVFGLQWSNVDTGRRLVWVEAEDTKSNTAIAIPLSDEALAILKSVEGQHKEWCFTYRGKPIKDIKTAFAAACVRAGLGHVQIQDGTSVYEGFTWHGFRHTWATWHVQGGTPLEVLQKLGGWSDIRMVLLYAHHSAEYLAGFANNTRKK